MTIFQKIRIFLKENPVLRKIVKNFSYLLSGNIISSFLSMIQGIFSIRILGVIGFGQLGTVTVFATTINKLTSFRMAELVIKYVGLFHETGEHKKAAAVFKIAALVELFASFFAFILIWLLAPIGAEYFAKDANLTNWFIIYGLVVLANMITETSKGLLLFFDRYRRMAILNVAQSVITLLLIIIAWWQNYGLYGVLLGYLVGKVINAIGLAIASQVVAAQQWGNRWWKTPLNILAPHKKELVRFGINTNINGTLSLISRDSSLLWVSYFTNPEQAGYYKFALALANYIQIPMAPMPQATYPELARAVAHRKWKEFRYIIKQGSRLGGVYSLSVALGLVIFGRLLIRVVYQPEFLPTYSGLLIMLVGIVFANTFYWGRSALLSLGLADHATKINVLVTIVTVVGFIFLLPTLGFIGASLLMSIGNVLGNTLVVMKPYSQIKLEQKLDIDDEFI
jgi:O-antigen/teichoic acid export membrane protein